MMTIVLKERAFVKGRMREKGEVITLESNTVNGRVIAKDIEKKNEKIHKEPKKGKDVKEPK